ncbi:hypothetical protein GUJ93_ZPchr0010g9731 [Zizania palustris]|uniref:MLLE-like domain-containing protein n=1 Tax=Zizania palustris TaxID=103762 RepID=A0A8J5T9Q0_ZIZPA|nr:hypothetical protein GUJ93_ZPchr0010g9731 [Zizania palustris]
MEVFQELSRCFGRYTHKGMDQVGSSSIMRGRESMMREAQAQEKIVSEEDTQQKLQNRAILELQKLGFTGTEVVNAALVFVKMPDQMRMLLALPDSLRREYILKMLADEAKRS